MGDKRRWRAVNAGALLWMALHVCTSVYAILCGLYRSYSGGSWALLGFWLLALLVLDAWLYVSGDAELLRSLKWFWGFSSGMFGIMLLVEWLDWTVPDLAALVFVICSFLTPVHQLEALLWRARELMGRELRTIAGCLFCLMHFVYLTRLHRRAMEKGVPPDGPVDRGGETEK